MKTHFFALTQRFSRRPHVVYVGHMTRAELINSHDKLPRHTVNVYDKDEIEALQADIAAALKEVP